MATQHKNRRISGFGRSVLVLAAVWLCVPASADESVSANADSPVALQHFQVITSHAAEVAMRAMALIGVRYEYGGDSPDSGMDCSGLVNYVFKEAWGASLPRTSEEISRIGHRIEAHELQPGDLVFYNTLRRAFSHVGIYLGDDRFIHSPSHGGQVRIERMDVNYWKKRFNGARRIGHPDQITSFEHGR